MTELFPVAAGLVAGALVAGLRPALRIRLGLLAAILLGVTATIVSGEIAIGWEYLLVDIPLVAVSAAAGVATTRAVRRRARI
jgi:hypothetical protein